MGVEAIYPVLDVALRRKQSRTGLGHALITALPVNETFPGGTDKIVQGHRPCSAMVSATFFFAAPQLPGDTMDSSIV